MFSTKHHLKFLALKTWSGATALGLSLTFGVASMDSSPRDEQLPPEPVAAQILVAGVAASEVPPLNRPGYTSVQMNVVVWPINPSAISSGFGHRSGCRAGCSTNHLGLDFGVSAGTPIGAVAPGVVTFVGSDSGYGTYVKIAHDFEGVTTLYGHMISGSARVHSGQHVVAGQVIGLVGSTGISTGSHLHLEVHSGGQPIDPLPWIRARAG